VWPVDHELPTDGLLDVSALEVAYGAVQVVWGVELKVGRGQVVTIIGPNGAGKTTTLKSIAALVPPKRGRIIFDGQDITREPAHERAQRRLCLVPEGRHLWANMTVEENLLMGAFSPRLRSKARQNIERIYELFPRLRERRKQACGTLSGGEQQMCAIGRGLMSDPLLLILDEPSLGLAPILVAQVFQMIGRIAAEGITILLAAQNAKNALEIADYAYVMEAGRIALEGPSDELRCSDHVRRAYLGVAV
jgi:branched-chain amino acid transport system ATP-binding protein